MLLVLLIGAAYRITRFVVTDSLIGGWRERLFNRFPPTVERARQRFNGRMLVERAVKDPARNREAHKLGQLLECPWCFGWWVSVIVVAISGRYAHISMPGLTILAVATGVGFLGMIDSALRG